MHFPTRSLGPLPLLVLLLLAGCRAEPGDADSAAVDPGAAPPLLPAGAGWTPAPGVMAADEALFLDPGWVVLDGLEGRLHLLDSLGRAQITVGNRGEGPGELVSPRHLVRDPGGFAVVGADGRLDRFDLSGGFLGRVPLDLGACPFPDIREAHRAAGRLFLALVCTGGTARRPLLLRIGPDGVAETVASGDPSRTEGLLPYGPVLGLQGIRPAWGSGDAPCVTLLPHEAGEPSDTLCVPGPPIRLSEELRREVQSAVGARARRAGVELALPDHLPWMDRILDTGDGSVLVRRPVDGTRWRLERLGSPGGFWPVPGGVEVHGGEGRLLLVHHGLDGVRLSVLPVAALPLHSRTPDRP